MPISELVQRGYDARRWHALQEFANRHKPPVLVVEGQRRRIRRQLHDAKKWRHWIEEQRKAARQEG